MLRRSNVGLVCLLVALLSPIAGLLSGGAPWQAGHAQGNRAVAGGIFEGLTAGQWIGVREEAGRYLLTVMPEIEQSHRVLEAGDEYLAVVDRVGQRETRIPLNSIKAIQIVPAGR